MKKEKNSLGNKIAEWSEVPKDVALGMPLSSSMAEVAAVRSLGVAALERKTAVSKPTGMPMMMAFESGALHALYCCRLTDQFPIH